MGSTAGTPARKAALPLGAAVIGAVTSAMTGAVTGLATGLWWHLAGAAFAAPGFGLLATAAIVALFAGLLASVVTAGRRMGGAPRAVRDRTLRRCAWRTAFLPQRDPDARGRTRPRAPTPTPAAA